MIGRIQIHDENAVSTLRKGSGLMAQSTSLKDSTANLKSGVNTTNVKRRALGEITSSKLNSLQNRNESLVINNGQLKNSQRQLIFDQNKDAVKQTKEIIQVKSQTLSNRNIQEDHHINLTDFDEA